MFSKECTECKITLTLDCFHKAQGGLYDKQSKCIQCRKVKYATNNQNFTEYQANYYQRNKDAKLLQGRKRRLVNKANGIVKIRKWKGDSKKRFRKYQADWQRNRRKTNLEFKLCGILRARIRSAVKRGSKNTSAVKNLGCTIAQFIQHIESQFEPGMTWENWTTTGWHLDHIRPISSFNLQNEVEFAQACHYTNLQPLWARDNHSKSDKLDWKRANG